MDNVSMKTATAPELPTLRKQIDRVDEELVRLITERSRLATEIGRIKSCNGLPVLDLAREDTVMGLLTSANPGPLPDSALKRIFGEIISACRQLQHPIGISYLGPEATFTHQAAMEFFGGSAEFTPGASVPDVFRSVETSQCDYGVVPVENSTEGSVNVTLDRLMSSPLKVTGEILFNISHCIISREASLQSVERVISHPQALAQCRGGLDRCLPNASVVPAASTAAAAEVACCEPGTAAVGSEMLSRQYGLEVLARDIQDRPVNLTRFLVLGHEDCAPTGRDKTSILFATPDQPGSLHRALAVLADKGVNLTRIESRPSKENPWEYVFFTDLDGHREDPEVKDALEKLSGYARKLKILGSYPVAQTPATYRNRALNSYRNDSAPAADTDTPAKHAASAT